MMKKLFMNVFHFLATLDEEDEDILYFKPSKSNPQPITPDYLGEDGEFA